jgi:hypothetical protein
MGRPGVVELRAVDSSGETGPEVGNITGKRRESNHGNEAPAANPRAVPIRNRRRERMDMRNSRAGEIGSALDRIADIHTLAKSFPAQVWSNSTFVARTIVSHEEPDHDTDS